MSASAKHAYLIMAHHQFELLKMLCKLLDHPQHDIFIHIDSKAQDFCPQDFAGITKHSPIIFTRRTDISWGGYSQIHCELLLLKAAKANNPDGYSYYHLLSGADLPLKTADEIYNFFQNNYGKEFIQCQLGDENWQAAVKKRINHYCIFQEKAGRSNKLWQKRQDKLRHWQYTFNIDRTKKLGKPIYSGANWFSITDRLADYVIRNEKWIKKFFGHSVCADELFLQTLICGTQFADSLYRPIPQSEGVKSCMRYVDWTRGEPYTFTEADYDELMNCGCIFARKFDIHRHPQICRRIFDRLTGQK